MISLSHTLLKLLARLLSPPLSLVRLQAPLQVQLEQLLVLLIIPGQAGKVRGWVQGKG